MARITKAEKILAALSWLGTYEARAKEEFYDHSLPYLENESTLEGAMTDGNANEFEFPEDMIAAYEWLTEELHREHRAKLFRDLQKQYPNATAQQIRKAMRNSGL
jgi:hypothetical protein